jgi:hypothetical protein
MPSASDSAYPRLKANPSATDLDEIYTPNIFELVFSADRTRQPAPQVGLLQLFQHQRRGRRFEFLGGELEQRPKAVGI